MTTKDNFSATNESMKENVAKGMKWMQDANAKLVETQKEQIKKMTDLLTSTLTTSKVDGSANLNNAFGNVGKGMADIFQKNVETANNFFKTTMKPTVDFGKFTDKDAMVKEMEKQIDTFNNQIADLTLVNQANLDTLIQQFDANSKSFAPIAEQFKKEIEKSVETSKEMMQSIVESYSSFTSPSMETTKETIEKLNDQIKSSIKANVKFWSDLMNPATSKAAEVKVDGGIIKISAPVSAKKQAATSMN